MDKELLAEFLLESNENMSTIEQQLMDLESNPGNASLLDAIFRTIHTVKGSCGFIGLKRLEQVAHAGENVLGKMRSHAGSVTPDIISLLLECADTIQVILHELQEHGSEPEEDHTALIGRLHEAEAMIGIASQQDGSEGDCDKAVPAWLADFPDEAGKLLQDSLETPEKVLQAGFNVIKAIDGIAAPRALKILGAAKAAAGKVRHEEEITEQVDCAKPDREVATADVVVAPTLKVAARNEVGTESTAEKPPSLAPQVAETIRVNVSLLDSLMNQVGELVLTRNRLLQLASSLSTRALSEEGEALDAFKALLPLSRELNHITESLQDQLLKTRMQPVSTIWGSVPRIVRDIGKQLDKKIRVVMEGQDTELDRTILTALKDPLTHIIRNSCDHGIELPRHRVQAGKAETGTVTLKASQEAGSILITISDDGGGIDAGKVKRKAIDMGVLETSMSSLSDAAALQFVFHPGLSTAEKVSNFSGRGVGMDVVKNAIEKVGGSVDIQSELGVGTTLSIRIPLTMAIISGMLVKCSGQLYALPQISVQELLAADADSPHWCMVAGKPFFRLRGQLLPVIWLGDALELPGERTERGSIVVINAGNRRVGVLVDDIFGAEELVVKPLGMHFSGTDVFGGCSILGDGSVVPILECNGLIHRMNIPVEAEGAGNMSVVQHQDNESDKQYTLVFVASGKRYAIPMLLVERLEMVEARDVEQAGNREVLQYRGQVTPVLRWNRIVDAEEIHGDELCCLIIADNNKRMCLQVDRIEDILETELHISMKSSMHLFLGTAVIQGKATAVVDVFELLKLANPDWFSGKEDMHERRSVLFVEDAPFFRTMLTPVLESQNFEVWHAGDGQEACEILAEKIPDIVLTDIEMPRMDGYELARRIQQNERFERIPVVAIASSPPAEDDERRRLFDVVLSKTDRDALTAYLSKINQSQFQMSSEDKDAVVFSGPVLVGGRSGE